MQCVWINILKIYMYFISSLICWLLFRRMKRIHYFWFSVVLFLIIIIACTCVDCSLIHKYRYILFIFWRAGGKKPNWLCDENNCWNPACNVNARDSIHLHHRARFCVLTDCMRQFVIRCVRYRCMFIYVKWTQSFQILVSWRNIHI